MKKLINTIATLITATAVSLTTLSCQPALAATPTPEPPTIANSVNGTYYPLTGIVTSVTPDQSDERTDVITFTCSNGNLFSFTAPTTDCWDVDDLVSCIMDNKGTGNVTDDEVLTAMYSGSVDQLEAQADYAK